MKKYTAFVLSGLLSLSVLAQEPASKNATQQETVLKEDAKDPICGMHVKKGSSLVSVHKGKQYGFCGKSCKDQFDKKPDKYLKKQKGQ